MQYGSIHLDEMTTIEMTRLATFSSDIRALYFLFIRSDLSRKLYQILINFSEPGMLPADFSGAFDMQGAEMVLAICTSISVNRYEPPFA